MASYPDFVCIGAQKAATTWLYNVLRRVPGVFLPAIKELHYFSEHHSDDAKRFGPRHRAEQIAHIREYQQNKLMLTPHDKAVREQINFLDSPTTDDDWYRSIFDFAGDNDICGEICPCYMSMPVRGIRHTMSINPLLRVLVLVRDPIDRAWSQMRMHQKTGVMDFNLDRILTGKSSMAPYMRYTDYANSLEHWKSMSGEGRFKAVVYDHIQSNPETAIQQILQFIGVPNQNSSIQLDKVVFQGMKVDLPVELRAKLLKDLEPQYTYLHNLFPQQVESWIDRHKSALCTTSSPDPV
tara:strand:+ start:294 stop:1178 length:885 start_codon:yes stop_codon:yes gene_type:complete